jgi:hypothetical protein
MDKIWRCKHWDRKAGKCKLEHHTTCGEHPSCHFADAIECYIIPVSDIEKIRGNTRRLASIVQAEYNYATEYSDGILTILKDGE